MEQNAKTSFRISLEHLADLGLSLYDYRFLRAYQDPYTMDLVLCVEKKTGKENV